MTYKNLAKATEHIVLDAFIKKENDGRSRKRFVKPNQWSSLFTKIEIVTEKRKTLTDEKFRTVTKCGQIISPTDLTLISKKN